MVKLLVADQYPIVTKGLELVFADSRDVKIVKTVADGEAIFEALKDTSVDILMCDIDLPKLNGISVLRRLRKDYPNIKTIIFSGQQEDVYAISTIKAGADGFLSKTSDLLTLKDAIMKVHLGGVYLSPSLSSKIALSKTKGGKGGYFKKLSTREVEVLKLLSGGRRNKEIAEELDINEKTVSTYKARLMKKLNVSNLIDLVSQAKNLNL
ncbi:MULTISPECIES: response regulator [Mesoflavibacter]|uniref:Response regulator transcription factor n=1 Tax=Mesoflavibacter profundi TaxID=2708110 RepID=A0ABT4RZV6_9FLAO|nr:MULTISPECIES: response regulator transcription factor [Mesoflavibacter]MDA0177353.1 response regulator transcription factor [Mesoflavibacter profundi]QIJ88271.1 Two-component transcriptional response regulator, LuxR family [Mesoflavibacter sp. HG96]QIJ90999.1 Two-component transcriptional response regulator, LuxR family [Mesoflavibacter sp. HG37]